MVGPNGSGKSNVIDAMLFVFGKRAKQVYPFHFIIIIITFISTLFPFLLLMRKRERHRIFIKSIFFS